MTRKLRPDYVRRKVWAHNAHFGRIRSAELAMRAIRSSPQATEQAKRRAHIILAELDALREDLQTRVDPPHAFQSEENSK